jgi:saxitoxin biosynthesis operon SxtJ-like protein
MTMAGAAPTERSFGLSIGSIGLAFGAFLWWRGYPRLGTTVVLVGTLLLILGLTAPSLLTLPNFLWWRFSRVLGWVNARILLTVFFAIVLTPVGVVMRLFGRNPLSGSEPDTNWRAYPARRADPKHYEHLF